MANEQRTAVLTIQYEDKDREKVLANLDAAGVKYQQINRVLEQRAPALEKLAQSYNAVYRVEQQYIANQEKLERAAAAYTAKTGDAAKAQELLAIGMSGLSKKYEEAIARANGNASAHANMNLRFQEAMHSGRGFVEMVIAGQSPIRAFAMEAGRATSVLTQVDQGFRSSLISAVAWGAPMLAAAAAIGVVVSHAMDLNSELRKLQSTGLAFNNQSLTGSQFQSAAHAMAASGEFSRAEAVAAVQEWEKARTLAAEAVKAGMSATVPFAEATGQKPQEAARQLAEAMKAGYDGIMKLNSAYGFLNPAQTQHILDLAREGHNTEAAEFALEKFTAQMEHAQHLAEGPAAEGFRHLGNAITKALDDVVNSNAFFRIESFLGRVAKFTGDHLGDIGTAIGKSNPTLWPTLAAAKLLNGGGADPNKELRFDMPPAPGAAGSAGAIADQSESALQTASRFTSGRVRVAGMYGPAQEHAAILQRYTEATQGEVDPTKLGTAAAERDEQLLALSARLSATTEQRIRDLGREATAAERLAEATGDYNATVKAQIANEIDRVRVMNPGLSGGQEQRIRSLMQQAADAKQQGLNDNFILDLQGKLDQKSQAINEALATGAAKPRGLLGVQATIDAGVRSGAIKTNAAGLPDPEQVKEATDLVNQYNRAIEKLNAVQTAAKFSPDMAYKQAVTQIDAARQHLNDLGLTEKEIQNIEDQFTQAVVDANIKRLEASRNWTDGAEAALMKYARDSSNYGHLAGSAITSGLNSATNALVKWDGTLKGAGQSLMSFADIAVKEMQRIFIQSQVTGPLSGFLSQGISGLFGSGQQVYGSAADVGPYMYEAPVPRADGGKIVGPGGPRDDAILAALSNGEFVVNAEATSKHLGLLMMLNDNKTPHFADGGLIGAASLATMGGTPMPTMLPMPSNTNIGGHSISMTTHVDARGATDPDAVRKAAYEGQMAAVQEMLPVMHAIADQHATGKVAGLADRVGRGGKTSQQFGRR